MRLLAFMPCEEVKLDATGGPSLIAAFQEINIQIPAEITLPGNAVVLRGWAVFALWQIDESERQHAYSQSFEILWPNGSPFLKESLPLQSEKPDWMTVIVRMRQFPAGQPGKVIIRIWIELEGERISETMETFVRVNHALLENETSIDGLGVE